MMEVLEGCGSVWQSEMLRREGLKRGNARCEHLAPASRKLSRYGGYGLGEVSTWALPGEETCIGLDL